MKQHFQIPWAQILIVCAALVMAFGMGTSVQVEQEAVGQREAFRRSLQMLDQYLCALSEDLGDPDILALEAPLEDDRIQENLVRVRRTSVALKQDYVSNAGRETSPHPHVYLYLLALEETLLESNYLDLEALSQILTICRPLWDIETGLSYKEIMAQLEAVQKGELEDWELEGARSTLLNSYATVGDSQGKLENFYLGQAATGQHETPADLARAIQDMTAERICRAMSTVKLDTVYFLKGKEGEA